MPPDMTEEERTKRREENIRLIQSFRLMDNPFMGRVFQDEIELGQLAATIMTGRDDIIVTSVITEHELPNLRGRSVRLDIHAFDHGKKEIDIEIQRAKKGATPKRIRYNSAMMDANFLVQREDFEDLPEQYIFFVTENDVTGLHRLISSVERRMGDEWSVPFRDGIHIAYIDSSQADDSPLGKLMHDFHCTRAADMYYPLLKEKVRYYKENETGVTIMSDLFEKYLTEEHNQGKAEGIATTTIKIVRNLLSTGKLSYEEIAKNADTSLDEVLRIAKESNMAY